MALGLKLSRLVKLRLRPLILLSFVFAIGLSAFAPVEAHARGDQCEAAFAEAETVTPGSLMSASLTASLSAELFAKLDQNTELLRHQLYRHDDGEIAVFAKNQSLRRSAQLALQIFKLNGVEAKLISHEGLIAVEIVSDPTLLNGWNRMATSLQKNYGTRLIYAPHSLVLHNTQAMYDRDTRAILISQESLRAGRAERTTLHEVGHMKSDLTKVQSPNVFSGFIEAALPEVPHEDLPAVAAELLDYRQGIDLDEVVRFAQDLDRLGRDLEKSEVLKTDALKIRSELAFVAKRGGDILTNADSAIAHAKKMSSEVVHALHNAGPLLLEDGSLAQNRAYVAMGLKSQVTIERFENGTLRLRLEDDRLTSEIWVKEETSWSSLIQKLNQDKTSAKREFQKRFANLVQHWENELKPSLNALRESSAAIISSGQTMPAASLSSIAKASRTVVAPHLRRTSK